MHRDSGPVFGAVLAAALMALALTSCGATPTPTPVPTPVPTSTPDPCPAAELASQVTAIRHIVDDFDGIVKLAEKTARVSLSPLVRDLQTTQAKLRDLKLLGCAEPTRDAILSYMSESIAGFLSFMANERDVTVNAHMSAASRLKVLALASLDSLARERSILDTAAARTAVAADMTAVVAGTAVADRATVTAFQGARETATVAAASTRLVETCMAGTSGADASKVGTVICLTGTVKKVFPFTLEGKEYPTLSFFETTAGVWIVLQNMSSDQANALLGKCIRVIGTYQNLSGSSNYYIAPTASGVTICN